MTRPCSITLHRTAGTSEFITTVLGNPEAALDKDPVPEQPISERDRSVLRCLGFEVGMSGSTLWRKCRDGAEWAVAFDKKGRALWYYREAGKLATSSEGRMTWTKFWERVTQ